MGKRKSGERIGGGLDTLTVLMGGKVNENKSRAKGSKDKGCRTCAKCVAYPIFVAAIDAGTIEQRDEIRGGAEALCSDVMKSGVCNKPRSRSCKGCMAERTLQSAADAGTIYLFRTELERGLNYCRTLRVSGVCQRLK